MPIPDIYLDYDHPYIVQRGITPQSAREFVVGGHNNRILFAVFDIYGSFVDFVPRVLDNTEPKYPFPSGFKKTELVYNYHRAKAAGRKAVVIVEGFVDLIKVHQAGYPSVVALMGSTMSQRQEDLLTRWWEYVIFMLDGDGPGRKAQKEFVERMNKRNLKGVFSINLPDGVQPDMLNPDQVQAVLRMK